MKIAIILVLLIWGTIAFFVFIFAVIYVWRHPDMKLGEDPVREYFERVLAEHAPKNNSK